jgi:peptidoglycan/xylan/chitin deacetylase (PgdA/CDA1 family)
MLEDVRVAWNARRLAERDLGGVYVLSYHGVVGRITDPRLQRNLHEMAAFRRQVALLKRLRTVSLEDLGSWLRGEARVVGGATVAVTFDDGYANNVEAASMLRDAGVPCSIFIVTDAVTTGRPIWTVELALLLLRGDAARVGALGAAWPLTTREQREESFQTVRTRMKQLPSAARRGEMETIRGQFAAGEIERLLEAHPEFRPLTWEMVRSLAASGVRIASHGVMHELHHAAQPPDVREHELTASKRVIEDRTGSPCRQFAFPNGERVTESGLELAAAGYELGFTTRSGLVRTGADPFALPRIEPGGSARSLLERLERPDSSAADRYA